MHSSPVVACASTYRCTLFAAIDSKTRLPAVLRSRSISSDSITVPSYKWKFKSQLGQPLREMEKAETAVLPANSRAKFQVVVEFKKPIRLIQTRVIAAKKLWVWPTEEGKQVATYVYAYSRKLNSLKRCTDMAFWDVIFLRLFRWRICSIACNMVQRSGVLKTEA